MQLKVFECKINGQALRATLLYRFCCSEGQVPTQGVSKSVAVAAGHNRLALGRSAATQALLTQFKIPKVSMLFKFRDVAIFKNLLQTNHSGITDSVQDSNSFNALQILERGYLQELVTDQSSPRHLPQSFNP